MHHLPGAGGVHPDGARLLLSRTRPAPAAPAPLAPRHPPPFLPVLAQRAVHPGGLLRGAFRLAPRCRPTPAAAAAAAGRWKGYPDLPPRGRRAEALFRHLRGHRRPEVLIAGGQLLSRIIGLCVWESRREVWVCVGGGGGGGVYVPRESGKHQRRHLGVFVWVACQGGAGTTKGSSRHVGTMCFRVSFSRTPPGLLFSFSEPDL